jgi:hypothetical protein
MSPPPNSRMPSARKSSGSKPVNASGVLCETVEVPAPPGVPADPGDGSGSPRNVTGTVVLGEELEGAVVVVAPGIVVDGVVAGNDDDVVPPGTVVVELAAAGVVVVDVDPDEGGAVVVGMVCETVVGGVDVGGVEVVAVGPTVVGVTTGSGTGSGITIGSGITMGTGTGMVTGDTGRVVTGTVVAVVAGTDVTVVAVVTGTVVGTVTAVVVDVVPPGDVVAVVEVVDEEPGGRLVVVEPAPGDVVVVVVVVGMVDVVEEVDGGLVVETVGVVVLVAVTAGVGIWRLVKVASVNPEPIDTMTFPAARSAEPTSRSGGPIETLDTCIPAVGCSVIAT